MFYLQPLQMYENSVQPHTKQRVKEENKEEEVRFTLFAVSVLQTEAGFVSLRHFGAVEVQQVIVGKNLHAVVMSGLDEENAMLKHSAYI